MKGKDILPEILEIIHEEKKKLDPVLESCPGDKSEIRAFILERYLEGYKAAPGFNSVLFEALNAFFGSKTLTAVCRPGEDPEEVRRRMQVAAMIKEEGKCSEK